jgi:hypothetical protein
MIREAIASIESVRFLGLYPNYTNKAPTVTIGALFTSKVFRRGESTLLHL